MKVLITGATGFLGQAIARELLVAGHELVVASRDPLRAQKGFAYPARFVSWNPEAEPISGEALEGVDAAVHLAGESIAAKRWSTEQKRRITDSRVLGTRHFWQGLARAREQGKARSFKTWIASSAIGYYGDRGDEWLTEDSAPGQGFLSEVCVQWERESLRPEFSDVRQVAIRTGIVLGVQGGALPQLLPIFKTGLGGPIAGGKQWMSWIHVDDLARVYVEALQNSAYQGPINGVAGEATNAEFSKQLGHVLGRPAVIPAPAFGLKLAMGEMSHLVLDSQRVSASKLEGLGFQFRYPELVAALNELCAPEGDSAAEQFASDQWVPRPVGEVFAFFSEAGNLEELTPPWLGFKTLHISDPALKQGTLIDYQLKIHGVPIRWRTEIAEWQPNRTFVDIQLKGPYAQWHHSHTFSPVAGGTLMQDRVRYRLPLGSLGKGVAHWKVRQDIEEIFAYRRKRILELFGASHEPRRPDGAVQKESVRSEKRRPRADG